MEDVLSGIRGVLIGVDVGAAKRIDGLFGISDEPQVAVSVK